MYFCTLCLSLFMPSATHFYDVTVICLYMELSPPPSSISRCNKTDIPSGVRRDSREGIQSSGALKLKAPGCLSVLSLAERCRGRRWGSRAAVGERGPSGVLTLADWQMGRDAQRCARVLFSEGCVSPIPPALPPTLRSHHVYPRWSNVASVSGGSEVTDVR